MLMNLTIFLPNYCFRGCKALEHVYILDREQFRIEKKAFMGCDSLNSVHFRIEKPENIVVVDDAFDEDTFNTCTIFIPSGTRWAYRHHPILGKFKNIVIEQKQQAYNPTNAKLDMRRSQFKLLARITGTVP